MNWITPTGTVDLTAAEVATLADAAARYDVLGGYGFNTNPSIDPAEVLAP